MYNNVYQHKTTRGFEKLIHAAWNRAKQLRDEHEDAWLVSEIADFLDAEGRTVQQYLAMEDATLVYQMQVWTRHTDPVLSDLARRFLSRDRLRAIDDPVAETTFADSRAEWEQRLYELVASHGFEPPEYYALRDDLKLTIYDPYIPEKEQPIQDPYNAIFIQPEEGGPHREISQVVERLVPVTGAREKRYRYYVPLGCRNEARQLAASKRW